MCMQQEDQNRQDQGPQGLYLWTSWEHPSATGLKLYTQSCRDNQGVEVSVQNFSCKPRRIIHLNNKGERKTARPGLPGMIEKRLPYNHIEWRKHVIKSTLSGLYSTLLYNLFTVYSTCKSSRILLSEVPYLVTISYGAFKALRLRLSLAGGGASSSCRVLSPHDHAYSGLYTRVRCINYSHGLPWHQNAPKISKDRMIFTSYQFSHEKKSSGYAVVLPCRISSLSSCWPSLHAYRQTEIHKLRMKSGLPPQEREAPLARSSFVSTLRHVKSQAKKQSTTESIPLLCTTFQSFDR